MMMVLKSSFAFSSIKKPILIFFVITILSLNPITSFGNVSSSLSLPVAAEITSDQSMAVQNYLTEKYGTIDVINQQSYPVVDGYWTTQFVTQGTHDLIISAINGTSFWGLDSDVSFVELYDGTTKIADPVIKNNKIIFLNYSSTGDISYLTVKVNTPGVHDLKLEFGSDVAYASNFASPLSVTEINDNTANGPTLNNNDNLGTAVAQIGDLNNDGVVDLAVGANNDDTGGSNKGAIHILFMNTDGSIDSTVEINDNTTNGPALSIDDYFGTSVAPIGDLNNDGVVDLAVGAVGDDTPDRSYTNRTVFDRGAIYILFMNTDGSVDSTAKIDDDTTNGPNLTNNDQFGRSVAPIGDLNNDGVVDLAVGSPNFNDPFTNRGAIYILFMNTNGSVDNSLRIYSSTTNGPTFLDAHDNFGTSVAQIGDLNNDGVVDLAVGANNDDAGGLNRGAIYILFMNTDGSLDSTAKIDDTTTNGPVLTNNDQFGISVAPIGDLNNDGVVDLAVGAFLDDAGGSEKGAIHIMFMNTDGSVDRTIQIDDTTTNGPNLNNNDYFGTSVAPIGDLNNDGVVDLAVSAVGDDTGGNNKGVIHIISLNSLSISRNAHVDRTIQIDDTTTNGPVLTNNDQFGTSVAPIGDLNNDGVVDLAVGTENTVSTNRGAINIMFMNTDGSIDSTVKIDDTTTNGPTFTDGDRFGTSVAPIGDLNNDGVVDLAVGAFLDDAGGSNKGAIHIMFMNTDGSIDSTVKIDDTTTNGPTLTDGDSFGISVAPIGDLNNDGVVDLAVGAFLDDAGGSNKGAIHIMFMNTDGSIDSTVKIDDTTTNGPALSIDDYFGISVAPIGDLNNDGVVDLAVGAFLDDAGGSNKGAIHIMFMNTDGSIDSTVKIDDTTTNGPTLTDGDSFGISVAPIGDLNNDGVVDLAVGAFLDDAGGSNKGAIHIMFMNTDGSVDRTIQIDDTTTNGPTLTDGDNFGRSVAPIGDLNNDGVVDLAVGANYDDTGGVDRGAIYIIFLDKTVIVNDVTSAVSDGSFVLGNTIDINLVFSEPVTVTGTPQLELETGTIDRMASYSSGSATSTLTFQYTVQSNDMSSDLDYVGINSLTLNGGTIVSAMSPNDNAILSLPIPGILGSLSFNKDFVIDTTPPTVRAAYLDEMSGEVFINFNERIDSTPLSDITTTGFRITDANNATGTLVPFTSSTTVSAYNTTAIVFTLTEPQRTMVVGHTTPDLDITAAAVHDAPGNDIIGDGDIPLLVRNIDTTTNPPVTPGGSDTTPPTVRAAYLDEMRGEVFINFNERIDSTPLSDITTTGFRITDANNATGTLVPFTSSTTVSAYNTTAIVFTLTEPQRTMVVGHTTPDLDITAAAVHDVEGNNIIGDGDIPLLVRNIDTTTNPPVTMDTTPPTVRAAYLDEMRGEVFINFNERIDSTPLSDITTTGFRITDANNATGTLVPFTSSTTVSAYNTTAIVFTLTEPQRTMVVGHTTPDLDITAAAVHDALGNDIIGDGDIPLLVRNIDTTTNPPVTMDTTPPTVRAAYLDEMRGEVFINFNERIDSTPLSDITTTGFRITDANNATGTLVPFTSSTTVSAYNTTAIVFTLTEPQRTMVVGHTTPDLDITAAAVHDVEGNNIIGDGDIPLLVRNIDTTTNPPVTMDTTPPTVRAAYLDEMRGEVFINFNERIDSTPLSDITTTGFRITDANNATGTLVPFTSSTTVSAYNTTAIVFTLTEPQRTMVVGHTTPDLDITAAAVHDALGNDIIGDGDIPLLVRNIDTTTNPPVTPGGSDTTPPTVRAAYLDEMRGEVFINFNERIDSTPLSDITTTGFRITDANNATGTLVPFTSSTTVSAYNTTAIVFTLTEPQRTMVVGHTTPDLDITAAAVHDVEGNNIIGDGDIPLLVRNIDTTTNPPVTMDTTPPTVRAAYLDEMRGEVFINFNERIDSTPLSDITTTGFRITDANNATGTLVPFTSSTTVSAYNTTAIVFTLTEPQRTMVVGHTTPDLDITAAAVHDALGNDIIGDGDIPLLVRNIDTTTNPPVTPGGSDTTPPTVRAAYLDEMRGEVFINFNERIDSTPLSDITTTGFRITDANNATGTLVPFTSSTTVSAYNTTAIVFTLTEPQRTMVVGHTTPDLDITAAAVHDVEGNNIIGDGDIPLLVRNIDTTTNPPVTMDTTPPTVRAAYLDEMRGEVFINFNERIDSTPLSDITTTGFRITDANNATGTLVPFTSSTTVSAYNTTAIVFTLTEPQRTMVVGHTTPDLDITAAAVHDALGNDIIGDGDIPLLVRNIDTTTNPPVTPGGSDTTPPTVRAAYLDEMRGEVFINFNERIDSTPLSDITTTGFRITDANNATGTLVPFTSSTTVSAYNTTAIVFTLTEPQRTMVVGHTTPDLDITAAAVHDVEGNNIIGDGDIPLLVRNIDTTTNPPVTMDTTPPTVRAAYLDEMRGEVFINFNERIDSTPLSDITTTGFRITDANNATGTLVPFTSSTTVSAYNTTAIVFTLTEPQRTMVVGHTTPDLDITAAAVHDALGNDIIGDGDIPLLVRNIDTTTNPPVTPGGSDTTPPTVRAAYLDEMRGEVFINFNERIDSTPLSDITTTGFRITDANNATGTLVPFTSSTTVSAYNTTAIVFTLTEPQRTMVVGHTTPDLDITAAAVHDVEGNNIIGDGDIPLLVRNIDTTTNPPVTMDTTPPTVRAAYLDEMRGEVFINFNERIDSTPLSDITTTGFRITDANNATGTLVPFTSSTTVSAYNTTAIVFTLTEPQRTMVVGHTTPDLDITAAAVHDALGNDIIGDGDIPLLVRNIDTTTNPPVTPGGSDTTPPTVRAAYLDEMRGEVFINFNERIDSTPLSDITTTGFRITDANNATGTLVPFTSSTTVSAYNTTAIVFTLTEPQRTMVVGHTTPDLDITAAAVHDVEGNNIIGDGDIPLLVRNIDTTTNPPVTMDTTPPTVRAAYLDEMRGEVFINFNERIDSTPLSDITTTGFRITDANNATGTLVPFTSSTTVSAYNTTAIVFTLTEPQRTMVVGHTTPDLDITAAAVHDALGNDIIGDGDIPLLVRNIDTTTNPPVTPGGSDTTPPTVRAAYLDEMRGEVFINFNERIDSTPLSDITTTGFRITDANNATGTLVPFTSSTTVSAYNTTAIVFTLTEPQRTMVVGHTTPDLDITAAAVHDVEGNNIIGDGDIPLLVRNIDTTTNPPVTMDTTPPTVRAAYLDEMRGEVFINFNERIDSTPLSDITTTGFRITDANNATGTLVPFTSSTTVSAYNTTAIVFTLTEPQRTMVVGHTTPDLDITAAAVHDALGNDIIGDGDIPLLVRNIDTTTNPPVTPGGSDTTPPTVRAAYLDEMRGEVFINFNERIDSTPLSDITTTGFRITDANNATGTLVPFTSSTTVSAYNTTAIVFTLTEPQRTMVVGHTTPDLDITAAAVHDVEGNNIIGDGDIPLLVRNIDTTTNPPVTMDTTPPTVRAAYLDEMRGEVFINFNERIDSTPLSDITTTGFRITDANNATGTLVPFTSSTTVSAYNTTAIVFTLTEPQRTMVVGHTTPDLDITAAAVHDALGNDIIGDGDIPLLVRNIDTTTNPPVTPGGSDTTPPTVRAAYLDEMRGEVFINFNERIDSTPLSDITTTGFRITDANNATGTLVPFTSSTTVSAYNTTAIVFTLTEPQRTMVVGHTTPDLDITAAAVHDVEGNNIIGDGDIPLLVRNIDTTTNPPVTMDTTPPTVRAAYLDEMRGEVFINFNERIDSTPLSDITTTGFRITDANNATGTLVPFTSSTTVSAYNTTAIVFTLTEPQRTMVVGHTTPDLDITAAAVHDALGNDIIGDGDIPLLVRNIDTTTNPPVTPGGSDTTPPTVRAAYLDEMRGEVFINFNERIDSTPLSDITTTGFRITDANNATGTLVPFTSSTTVSAYNTTAIVFTLTEPQRTMVVGHTTPDLDITAAAVHDVEGNNIIGDGDIPLLVRNIDTTTNPPVTMDTTPPTVRAAYLDEMRGEVFINFNERIDSTPLSDITTTGFRITDANNATGTLVPFTSSTTVSAYNTTAIVFTLTEPQRTMVVGHTTPDLDITAAAVHDALGNDIIGDGDIPLLVRNIDTTTNPPVTPGGSDTTPPTVRAAYLDEMRGEVFINFNERIDSTPLSDITTTGFRITDANNATGTLVPFTSSTTVSAYNTTAIVFTLTEPQRTMVVGHTTPDLDITAAAVHDVEGNNIIGDGDIPLLVRNIDTTTNPPVTPGGSDTTPPTVRAAYLDEMRGEVFINFNERIDSTPLSDITTTGFRITDANNATGTLVPFTSSTTVSAYNTTAIVFTLTEPQRTMVVGHTTPDLDITAAAVHDVEGNNIIGDGDIPLLVRNIDTTTNPPVSLVNPTLLSARLSNNILTMVFDRPVNFNQNTFSDIRTNIPSTLHTTAVSSNSSDIVFITLNATSPAGTTGTLDIADSLVSTSDAKSIIPLDNYIVTSEDVIDLTNRNKKIAITDNYSVFRSMTYHEPLVNATIDFSNLPVRIKSNAQINSTATGIAGGTVFTTFAANSTITGPVGFTGVLNMPEDLGIECTILNPTRGVTMSCIEIGQHGNILSINPPARILLSGQAGNIPWFAQSGITTEIVNVCTSDGVAGFVANECFINVGSDLVIWTDHFTAFGSSTLNTSGNNNEEEGGGGGGCSDCTPPVLGYDSKGVQYVSDGFTYNGNSTDVQYFYTPYPLITVNVGEQNTAEFKIYENSGPQNIRQFEFGFGLEKNQYMSESKVRIEYAIDHQGNGTTTVIDPQNVLNATSLSIQTDIVPCLPESNNAECMYVKIDHTFVAPLEFNIVGTNVWDEKRNSSQNFYNHGISVKGESLNPPKEMTIVPDRLSIVHHPADTPSINLIQIDTVRNLWIDSWGYVWHGDELNMELLSEIPFVRHSDKSDPLDRMHSEFTQSMLEQQMVAQELLDFTHSFYSESLDEYADNNVVVDLELTDHLYELKAKHKELEYEYLELKSKYDAVQLLKSQYPDITFDDDSQLLSDFVIDEDHLQSLRDQIAVVDILISWQEEMIRNGS